MKIEEAIEYNKNLRMYMRLSDKYQPCKFLKDNHIALDMAIRSLEAWGKIKEEIKGIDENPDYKPIGTYDYVMGSEDCRKVVLEIIGKHLSEVSEWQIIEKQ